MDRMGFNPISSFNGSFNGQQKKTKKNSPLNGAKDGLVEPLLFHGHRSMNLKMAVKWRFYCKDKISTRVKRACSSC